MFIEVPKKGRELAQDFTSRIVSLLQGYLGLQNQWPFAGARSSGAGLYRCSAQRFFLLPGLVYALRLGSLVLLSQLLGRYTRLLGSVSVFQFKYTPVLTA